MKNDFDSLLRSIFPGQTGSGNVSEEEKARIRRRMEALERQTAQSITNTQQEILRQTTQFQEEHRRAETIDTVIKDTQTQLDELNIACTKVEEETAE